MPRFPHPPIEAFFPPIPKPTPPQRKRKADDGPDEPAPSPPSPWTPQPGSTYAATAIGAIKAGSGRITFTGRVANFREQERSSKAAAAAKVLLKMALMDDSGVVDVHALPPSFSCFPYTPPIP